VSQRQATIVSYTYDAFGRCTTKTISSVVTQFAYDGSNVIQEQDGNGTPISTFTGVPDVSVRASANSFNAHYSKTYTYVPLVIGNRSRCGTIP
jgi:YD repeat-containing protein